MNLLLRGLGILLIYAPLTACAHVYSDDKSPWQEDIDAYTKAQVTDRDGDGQLTQRDVFLRDYERMRRGEVYVPNHEGARPPGMTFDFGESSLKPYTIRILQDGLKALKEYPETKFEISGHTDSIESGSYDQELSLRRARAAYDYLISQGIDPSRLKLAGYGASRPISPNTHEDGSDYPEGRTKNRRIELSIED